MRKEIFYNSQTLISRSVGGLPAARDNSVSSTETAVPEEHQQMEAPWKRVCELLLDRLIVGLGLKRSEDQMLDRDWNAPIC